MCLETNILQNIEFRQADSWNGEKIDRVRIGAHLPVLSWFSSHTRAYSHKIKGGTKLVLSFDDFKPVTLEDRDFFRQFYSLYPQTHSDNTFTNMVCWNHYANYSYAKINGNVILASTIDGITRYRPPMGPQNPSLVKDLVRLAADVDDTEQIILIDPATAGWMQSIYRRIDMVPDRDSGRVRLQGRRPGHIAGERLSIHPQGDQQVPAHVCSSTAEPISSANCNEIKKYLDQWYATKNHDGGLADYEKEAVLYSLDHMKELGLSGLAIRVDGRIGAMSIFEGMNRNTALIHFEKGLPEYEGIYKVINQEAASLLSKNYEFINRESDLGIPGLREAKMRYHPHHMVEVYSASRPKMNCKLHELAKCVCCHKCCTSEV